MIVDQLNTGLTGGAAVAAMRLHIGLNASGMTSRLWYKPLRKGKILPPVARLPGVFPAQLRQRSAWRGPIKRLRHKLEKTLALMGRPPTLEQFNIPWGKGDTPYLSTLFDGDILHLHWVNSWLDWPTFFASLPAALPVVWTLHDMNPITGGCHHADGCEAFHDGCGNCPQLKRSGSRDISQRAFADKLLAYRGKNLHIVTPSRWLQKHAERSGLMADAASIRTIHNGLDIEQFAPFDKMAARRELGLPADKTILGFGAPSLKNRRKGFPEFVAAISRLNRPADILCLSFGDKVEIPNDERIPKFHMTGYLHSSSELALVHSAADIFVIPSLAENMPQTAVEAMACGTPVVGFDVGGIPEIVLPGKTGCLAQLGNCAELGSQIQWLIDHPDRRREMGDSARKQIVREFDQRTQTQQYIALYKSIIHQQSPMLKSA